MPVLFVESIAPKFRHDRTADEQRGVNQVLNAAALAYVAALATSLLQLTYFASLAGSLSLFQFY